MKQIYQLKITTKGIKPPVWRTVLVPNNITLADLHEVIVDLFGFYGYHLFAFIPGRQTNWIGTPSEDDFGEPMVDAKSIKLWQQFTQSKKLGYMYDFGDSWEFTIELQKVLAPDNVITYPTCLSGKGNHMLEDVGGIPGYEVITNWCRNKTKANAQKLIDFYGMEEVLEDYKDYAPDELNIEEIDFRTKF